MRKCKLKNTLITIAVVTAIPTIGLIRYSPSKATQNSPILNDIPDKTIQINYNGEVKGVSLKEYLKGTLAAEMPNSFEVEAQKAQVIAAHTYALNRYGKDGVYPTDPSVFQAYIDEDKRRQIYKDNFQTNEARLNTIIDDVKDLVIIYDDKPIVAAFFSMSGGKTEDCSNVFGSQLPYLTATDSSYEVNLPNFTSQVKIDNAKLKNSLEKNIEGLNFIGKPCDFISIASRDGSDYVNVLNVMDKQVSGVKFRSILGLASANFTIEKSDDGLTFICKGKGHGVGMSQYGANELAKNGMDYQSIIKYYYQGTTLKKI